MRWITRRKATFYRIDEDNVLLILGLVQLFLSVRYVIYIPEDIYAVAFDVFFLIGQDDAINSSVEFL